MITHELHNHPTSVWTDAVLTLYRLFSSNDSLKIVGRPMKCSIISMQIIFLLDNSPRFGDGSCVCTVPCGGGGEGDLFCFRLSVPESLPYLATPRRLSLCVPLPRVLDDAGILAGSGPYTGLNIALP